MLLVIKMRPVFATQTLSANGLGNGAAVTIPCSLSLGCSLKKGCVALYKSCFLFRIVVNCCIEAGAYYSFKCSPESETILYQECFSPSRLYNSGTESNCLDESSFNPLLLSIPHVQHQASSACGLIIASYAALLLTWFEPGTSAFFPTRSPAQVPAFTPDQIAIPSVRYVHPYSLMTSEMSELVKRMINAIQLGPTDAIRKDKHGSGYCNL